MSQPDRIRPAAPSDLARLYEICLRTADAGADATALHSDPMLVGHVFAAPYLHHAPEHAFVVVDEDDVVGGYVLGARDSRRFEATLEREWWPELRARYPQESDRWTDRDRETVALIHAPSTAHEFLAEHYPSHLHIDLLPAFQGRGNGRRLIEALIDSLVTAGSPGVHLGVSIRNERAIGFYGAIGFAELGRNDEGAAFVRQLP